MSSRVTRSQKNQQTPQKDSGASESEDHESDSDITYASGSMSYCSESPGSASFEDRCRSTLSSPGSGSESPRGTRKLKGIPSPIAMQRGTSRLYPKLPPFTQSPGPTEQSPTKQSPTELSQIKTKKKQKECKKSHIDENVIVAVLIVIAIVIGVIAFLMTTNKPKSHVGTQTPNPRQVIREAFTFGARKLTAAFPSQTSKFWATINAAVKSIMDPNNDPLQPAVVMVTCVEDTCPLANCIASQIATTVTEAYASERPLDLNVTSELLALRAEDAKLRIDDDFRAHLQYGSRAVILRNLQDLQGGAAMILHGFCDNDNAPFKEAVLIFTLQLERNTAINTAIGLNNAIEATLDKSWGKDLDTDNLSALYSRLVNSPVHVKTETNEVFRKQCV